nr:diaminopimelate decarboxylase [Lachnospiraceae bacterium]
MISDSEFRAMSHDLKTPVFVFDQDELLQRIRQIDNILNNDLTKKQINMCYSVKANPFLIPSMLKDCCIDNFEVCSPGELLICREYKVPPEKIIYSGVHKELSDISDAIEYGVSVLTAESLRHYELICEA